MGNASKTWKTWCLGLTAAILATIALLFTCLSNFWCHNYRFNSTNTATKDLQVGLWYYTGIRQSGNQIFGDKGDEDETLFVNTHKCIAYPPGINRGNFWEAARAFSIIATILGAVYMILLWLTPCVYKMRPRSWRTTGITMMIFMPLFQGLTFLFWRSDQCKSRSQTEDIIDENDQEDNTQNFLTTYPGSCQWNQGSSLNVVAIALWFLLGLFMALTHPPAHHHDHMETTTEIHEKHSTVTPGTTMATGTTGTGAIGGAHTVEHRSDVSSSSNNSHGMHHGVTPVGTGYTPTPTTMPAATTTAPHFAPTSTGTEPHFGTTTTGTDAAMHPTTTNPAVMHHTTGMHQTDRV